MFDKTQWLNAMNEEMKSLHLNNTWTLVCRLEGSMLVSCKWIFQTKRWHSSNWSTKIQCEACA